VSFQEFENCQCSECGPICQCGPDLSPETFQENALGVFGKVLTVHAGTALVTLSLCPQFGFRLLGQGFWSLFDLFMIFGHTVCTILCAVFFLGSSLAVTRVVLNLEEWALYFRKFWIINLGILGTTLGFFALVATDRSLHHLGFWLVGAALILVLARTLDRRPVPAVIQRSSN
jgi:hypothetical protein